MPRAQVLYAAQLIGKAKRAEYRNLFVALCSEASANGGGLSNRR
jgi:hypothetical protein